jgi:hypothetical protein
MREAEHGRVVRPSTGTVGQFLAEWFAAVEASLEATTWQNWKDYARAYIVPRIGAGKLQQLDEPQLLKLYPTLIAEGRVKRDWNSEMFKYWSARVANSENPKPLDVSQACGTSIHAARAAVRRYKSGIAPKERPAGLATKTVRNVHAMLHRALVDAVAWKYIAYNRHATSNPPSALEIGGRCGTRSRSRLPDVGAAGPVRGAFPSRTNHRNPTGPNLWS